jgi:hypothetical protein
VQWWDRERLPFHEMSPFTRALLRAVGLNGSR